MIIFNNECLHSRRHCAAVLTSFVRSLSHNRFSLFFSSFNVSLVNIYIPISGEEASMLRRNYTPTPLGYAVLTFFSLITLYFLTPADSSISLLPSSWSSQSDKWATPHGSIGEEEDELDSQPLPLLPKAYASEFPDLKLPRSLRASPKLYALNSRLVSFLSRPVLSHSAASQANLEGCPSELSDKLVNPDQYAGDGWFWRDEVDEAEIVRRRADVVRYLSEAVERGEQVLGQEGETGKRRGIVLTGGNQVRCSGVIGDGKPYR